MKNIALGQYYAASSPLHRLDPRMKILLALFYIVITFLCDNLVGAILLLLSGVVLLLLSRIPARVVLRSLKPLLFIMIFTAAVNIFWRVGEGEPLVSFWIVKIYKEGIVGAVYLVLRIMILVLGTSLLLTYTTTPIALTDGIERLLSPLKKIHVPVHEFAMIMTIALRFIPTLMEEADKIVAAQKARGADFTSGSLVRRAKALVPILIPLLFSSFRHAVDLSTAMECRCYRGGEGRTRMKILRLRGSDFAALALMTAFLGLVIVSRVAFHGVFPI